MTGNEYQKLAMRTTRDEWKNTNCWDQKVHAIVGLSSEAGEVASILQHMYQGEVMNPDKLKKEIGDCLWFIAEICEAFNMEMDDIMQSNIAKLIKRYPDGFSEERSRNRNEEEV